MRSLLLDASRGEAVLRPGVDSFRSNSITWELREELLLTTT